MVLITNNKPRVSEDTEAVWRRVRLIPFNVVIPAEERDPNLIEELQAERPGILAWCVRGYLEQLRDGMNPPAEVMLATEQYRQESDELADFIAACCIEGSDTLRVTRADLYATYLSWAKRSNERPMDRNALYEAIRRRDGIQQGSWKMDGKAVRGCSGIGLAASA
jgi:putative DNA primase/helicase